ncbi:MAG: LacI family DNA-binding transcriptional regulator [Caldicoprobacterales bacterium]|nr:LacI family transcriptional regulator [Clostridiales bacterium]
MATIYDIAKKAGVSTATVSRVINGVNHPIKEETRQRILQIAQELNYRPNAIAKSLAGGKSHTIALLIPSITNDFYTQICEVIEEKLEEKGYHTYLCNTRRNVEKESRYVESLIARQVDGVIFSPTRVKPQDNQVNLDNIDKLRKNGIAVVAFGSQFKGVSQIYINTYKGAFDATRYLISLGHKRIGFIDGLSAGTRKSRRRGYIKALEESGIGFDPWLVTAGNLQMEDGYACAYKLLSLENPPTAILAANNLMAIGVLKAARDKGLNVPGNLSVIGFDDSLLSKVVDPSLTVIKQPLKEIGEAAVNLLMNQLEGNQKHETIQLETRIVRRQSCGNPKERG